MKHLALGVMTMSLLSAAVPASAATVLQISENAARDEIFTKDYAPDVLATLRVAPAADGNAVDLIGNTIANYAAMLPEPSEWVLLVSGFGVIGYAMRSRKRAHISFN